MLDSLTVQNIVLIDNVELSFTKGLCVLTGETGAGKSILLDALGLITGGRADTSLIRRDAEGNNKSTVTAVFDIPSNHEALLKLTKNNIDPPSTGEPLILRRTLTSDGRSRAFVNDQSVSVNVLRDIGESLIEIEGQFASNGLLNPATHRDILDTYGNLRNLCEDVKTSWDSWKTVEQKIASIEEKLVTFKEEEQFVRHVYTELLEADPQEGEEETLTEIRVLMLNADKVNQAIQDAINVLTGETGFQEPLSRVIRGLEKTNTIVHGSLQESIDALDRTLNEAADASDFLNTALNTIETNPNRLESIEERLFKLKALARKHNTDINSLPKVMNDFKERLDHMTFSENNLDNLRQTTTQKRCSYVNAAAKLREARKKAALSLNANINEELPHVRLEKACFLTKIDPLSEKNWTANGMDNITFEVAPNPGISAGPINKIASGGELARLMLALKVSLLSTNSVSTLIFDEVDAGIGGSTAASIARRLSRLSEDTQVLVVTHSPQVAARGDLHFHIQKKSLAFKGSESTVTRAQELSATQRREEIARMLAGTKITQEARAAAESLLNEVSEQQKNV